MRCREDVCLNGTFGFLQLLSNRFRSPYPIFHVWCSVSFFLFFPFVMHCPIVIMPGSISILFETPDCSRLYDTRSNTLLLGGRLERSSTPVVVHSEAMPVRTEVAFSFFCPSDWLPGDALKILGMAWYGMA